MRVYDESVETGTKLMIVPFKYEVRTQRPVMVR